MGISELLLYVCRIWFYGVLVMYSSSTCYYIDEISVLPIALLIRISGTAPSLLVVIAGFPLRYYDQWCGNTI